MSGPWEPYATPLPPCHSRTEERWRRLPLMSTSVWSGARLRSMAGAHHGRGALDSAGVFELNDGDDRAELLLQVSRPAAQEVGGRQDVHGDRRLGGAARRRAGANDHRFLGESGEQALHLRRRQAQRLDLLGRHPQRVAELLDQLRRRPLGLLRCVILDCAERRVFRRKPCRREKRQRQGKTGAERAASCRSTSCDRTMPSVACPPPGPPATVLGYGDLPQEVPCARIVSG